ncbi:hypothetical protein BWQ96_08701 [Gracilariopsis chorda]|uniref:Uncharacterized protein n=1 Tax=Gracilariopsis chorda TaxID=448386 RepID=A0A2V3IHN0_9FLOR|nr:hypothetical protein BWQ96_08701 [Gracilariopsis chorda]|eukprot:PXF41587.1 hypothetical protein BWQ96_08701 [Gracilariopsis chorda]
MFLTQLLKNLKKAMRSIEEDSERRSPKESLQGVRKYLVRAATDCDLSVFEALSWGFYAKARDANRSDVTFYPEFRYTQ